MSTSSGWPGTACCRDPGESRQTCRAGPIVWNLECPGLGQVVSHLDGVEQPSGQLVQIGLEQFARLLENLAGGLLEQSLNLELGHGLELLDLGSDAGLVLLQLVD